MTSLRTVSLLLFLGASSVAQNPRETPTYRAQLAATALQAWYVPTAGLYRTTGWWNAANALTALIDLTRADGVAERRALLATTFDRAQVPVSKAQQNGALANMTGYAGFLNDYYDDEGWWALAWIDAYDLTGERRYLAMAESIFADMTGGWDDTCGGGIWWSKQRTYKNAIANSLFLSVATHLAVRSATAIAGYATWADREWRWFHASGMINDRHLVNDGLRIEKATGTCTNNGRTVWTYNQGVLLGALAEWSRFSSDPQLLLQARILGDAGLSYFTDTAGVVHDVCEPASCGADAPQFKGILLRNLRALNRRVHDPRYTAAFVMNAASIWQNDRSPGNRLGLVWSGPALPADAATQSSALDALVSALPESE